MDNSTVPQTWDDLYKSDRPIDFQAFLQSDLLAGKRRIHLVVAIIRHVAGSISLIASTAIIWHILRSYDGLSTTYHRLVFGLCICDIILSSVIALSTTMAPKEMEYFIPNARGNVASCDAQGFLYVVGFATSSLYNCSLCFYYLAIIKYSKKEDYIRNKLEPWFHGISIILPLVSGVILLAAKAFNSGSYDVCLLAQSKPPHCIGYENGYTPKGYNIPCGRGDLNDKPFLHAIAIVGHFIVLASAPIVVLWTMLLMYRTVLKIEKRMQRYGVRVLRARIASHQSDNLAEVGNEGVMNRIKNTCKCIIPCQNGNRFQPRSNNARSQKRAILNAAFGYAVQ
jgi:hypothetical protein